MSFVQLKFGDMFDGPSDLIVLPCSTAGTVTSMVKRRLIHHRIPTPDGGMKLGDLSILPFEGGENIAQFVGFAASVDEYSSDLGEIRRIGMGLGDSTKEQEAIRRIAAPLLGSGAGGLDQVAVIDALSAGFKSTAHPAATLVIHVLEEALFNRLQPVAPSRREEQRVAEECSDRAPRVFVSYCHGSPDDSLWVEELALFLRSNGIDARLDVWHLRHGMDLPQWMTNEITLADRVVLISDETYAEKADGRLGGVGWETMIVQGDLSRLQALSTKYLVIVRSREVDKGLPLYLRTKFVIHWPKGTSDDRNRRALLQELHNVIKAPPIGRRPVFL